MKILLRQVLIMSLLAAGWKSNAYSQNMPLDPAVRTAKLANGFTYYIRYNGEPKKRAELYLVNKVGSILEDDDQQGLAHFMEHMNFNGTKHFPKNNLVQYLQKAGISFGSDLNAYTSFDETVYQLPIPLDDSAMLAHGIRIMRDWAQEATLDSLEIEKERGVILEEKRLGKGAGDRMARRYLPFLYNCARYADRLPIGKDSILTSFKPGKIRQFFADWYRPNLQALIIVGDINVDETEKMVRATFSDLKNPTNERERIKYTLPLSGQREFFAVTDKEATVTNLGIMMINKTAELKTEGNYIEQIKKKLFNDLMNMRRYAQQLKEANPAYIDMNAGIGSFFNGYDMFSISISSKEGKLNEGFYQAWRIVERVKKFGFTSAEFERVKRNYLSMLENAMKEQNKIPSVNYVNAYQSLFLNGNAAPGITWEYRFIKAHLNDITLNDITELMTRYFGSKDVKILITAPDKEKNNLPDLATVNSWIAGIEKESIAPFKDEIINKSLLSVKPVAGKVIKTETIPRLGITQYTLSNGVKVVMKPTDFKNDQILYSAFKPGGSLLYDGIDYLVAANAGGIVSKMGYGDFNPAQLSTLLAGKIATSSATITAGAEVINGSARPQDLETALMITYLQCTSPRKDTLLFNNILNSVASITDSRNNDPGSVFADTVNYVMKNYDYRAAPVTAAKLKEISLERTYEIYRERFADASGFTFVFTGNFEPKVIKPFLEKYLGGLPSLHKKNLTNNLNIHEPEGQIVKKVYMGTENKALINLVFGGTYRFDAQANLELNALCGILQIKVLQHLRENESEVYSPQVSGTSQKYPENRFLINVSFGCAPENADHLIAMVEQEMKDLRENGPEEDDIDKFKISYEKNYEMAIRDNGFWLGYLIERYENSGDLLLVLNVAENLKKVTRQSLKEAAALFLSGKNMITFELLPESKLKNGSQNIQQ